MSAELLNCMGRSRSQQICKKNYIGSTNSFFKKTPFELPLQDYDAIVQYKGYTGYDKNYSRIEGTTCLRESYTDKPKFPIKDVFSTKIEWRYPPNIRPSRAEQVCPHQTFSSDFSCICARISSTSRLDDKDRHLQCLFSSSYCKVPSLLSQNGLQWGNPPNVIPPFWPGVCSSNLCSVNELDCGNPSFPRKSSSSLSRRFPTGPPGPVQVGYSDCGSREPLGVSGMADKLSKVYTETDSTTRVSRRHLEHTVEHDVSLKRKKNENRTSHFKYTSEKAMQLKTNSENSRSTEFRQLCSSKGPPSLPVFTASPKAIQRESKNCAAITPPGPERSQVVGWCGQEQKRPTSTTIHTLSDNRCSTARVGSSIERDTNLGEVDSRAEEMALELERAIRSICVDSESIALPAECSYSSPVRQSDTSGLHSERGRYTLCESSQSDMQVVEVDREVEHCPVSTLPPGEVQLHRRSPLTGSEDIRMAPVAHCNKPIISSLGHSGRRPVRVRRNSRGQHVRLARLQRSICTLLKRIQPALAISSGLDISSPQPHTSGSNPTKQCHRDIYSNNSMLGKDILVGRSAISGPRATCDNREAPGELGGHCHRSTSTSGRPTKSSSLVGWRWGEQISNWSDSERQLLNDSWRKSTMDTYYPAIKRWLQWCDNHNVNSSNPDLQQITRFLAYLHLELKLSYSTILVNKSAIFTFCKINQANCDDQVLLKQILKSIAAAQPTKPKTPVWDPQIVFDWLSLPNDRNTLFEASRRTAAILLLASGRRVHDLTLLKVSDSHMFLSEDKVILRPTYGSKTDTARHRQSDWQLLKHPNHQVCPVTWLRRLVTLSHERRSEVEGLDNLFITITGRSRPASRTMIGGWVRSILKDAGISATPGSFRSAVASASWVDNHPVDDILARGNWKAENTFKKFYYKEIQYKSNRSQLLFENFKPD